MAAALYAPRGVELVIKRVVMACQGPTCKALRAFVRLDKRYKMAIIYTDDLLLATQATSLRLLEETLSTKLRSHSKITQQEPMYVPCI